MKQNVLQKLNTAQQLLQECKYKESLSTIDNIEFSELDSSNRGEYYLLLGENLLFQGNYNHDYLEKAILIYKFTSNHEKFAYAKYLRGWQYQFKGDLIKAKEYLLESYISFLRIDNLPKCARVLNRLSYVCLLSGDMEQAIENLNKCIKYYSKERDVKKEVVAKNNLALVHFKAGNLSIAHSIYKEEQANYDILDDKSRCVFKLGFSMVHALQGNINTAISLLEDAYDMTNDLMSEKSQYFEYLGKVLLLNHNYKDAETALKKGLGIALGTAPDSCHISQIKRLLGDVYVAIGEFDLAEQVTNEALAVAGKINEQVEIAACYRIFALLEIHRGNNNKAKDWFQKAYDLFNMISSRYELAITRYLACTSELYSRSEKMAMLFMALEYFKSEKITHYIDKIDHELDQTTKIISKLQRKIPCSSKSNISCPKIITVNKDMKKLLELAENVAQSEMTVFLTGDTGTGKDLLARYIHYHSERPGRFVSVNATAIPNDMIEAELFGYRKGAFTGADIDKPGLFEEAHNGTFYLNEIADATLEFQAKLLEVLETHHVRRLGENKNRSVKFRLIAATNQDLKQQMDKNKFRIDLYHRLNEIPINLPSLNERTEDISALVQYFLKESGFDISSNGTASDIKYLIDILSGYNWDGNIRQLKAELNHLLLISNGKVKEMITHAQHNFVNAEEESELVMALNSAEGNKSKAARILGLHESTFRYRLRKQKDNF